MNKKIQSNTISEQFKIELKESFGKSSSRSLPLDKIIEIIDNSKLKVSHAEIEKNFNELIKRYSQKSENVHRSEIYFTELLELFQELGTFIINNLIYIFFF